MYRTPGAQNELYDGKTGDPVSRVLLILGSAETVSDRNGNCKFCSFHPGTHYLYADTARIGRNRIKSDAAPVELSVKSNEKVWVDIPIVKASIVTGQVVTPGSTSGGIENGGDKKGAEKIKSTGARIYDGGIAGLLVEIYNDRESRKTITDENGHFSFVDLHPGSWTIDVSMDDLYLYSIEQKQYEIELELGEEEIFKIQAISRTSKIHRVEEDGVVEVE